MCTHIFMEKIKLPQCSQSASLYKGMVALIVGFVLVEYLSYTITTAKIKSWNDLYFFNTTRTPLGETTDENIFPNITLTTPNIIFSNNYTDVVPMVNSTVLNWCKTPSNLGEIPVIKSPVPSIQELEKRFSWLKPGGHWRPDFCRAKKKIAIIVPFRWRGEHLLLFLQHMHPFLRKQRLDYTIFVVEQDDNESFNRAMLMNVGSYEALKIDDFDCFIWHDVDLLPENDKNLYTCPEQPRHMSVAIDVLKYKLPYAKLFGGVSAMSREHFELVNGFSNQFWGWGGEDDDMYNRIQHYKLNVTRYPSNIARYKVLPHKPETPSPNRYIKLNSGYKRFHTDGLNSLKYTLKETKHLLLYTWFLVKLDDSSS